MNLRDLKKDIEYIIGEFIDDCSLFVTLNPGKDSDENGECHDCDDDVEQNRSASDLLGCE